MRSGDLHSSRLLNVLSYGPGVCVLSSQHMSCHTHMLQERTFKSPDECRSPDLSPGWTCADSKQTFQLSQYDCETPGMRHLPPVPWFYIQLSRRTNLVQIPTLTPSIGLWAQPTLAEPDPSVVTHLWWWPLYSVLKRLVELKFLG